MIKKEDIEKILAKHDIMDIVFEDLNNDDEYSPEAEEIYQALPNCKSLPDLERSVETIFKKKFGETVSKEKGRISLISGDIWDNFHKEAV